MKKFTFTNLELIKELVETELETLTDCINNDSFEIYNYEELEIRINELESILEKL